MNSIKSNIEIAQMDWEQVALLDGTAPCFFIEGPEFCGRAMSYPGHGNASFHYYVSLQDFIATTQSALARQVLAEIKSIQGGHHGNGLVVVSRDAVIQKMRDLFTRLKRGNRRVNMGSKRTVEYEVKEARQRLQAAAREYEAACLKAFPSGKIVSYRHGKQLRFARVIGHGGARENSQLQVQGAGANTYWIHAYRAIEELN